MVDMEAISSRDLADRLMRFYCEARSKSSEVYHKNTLINLRAAINRHLADLKRNIDIVKDPDFKTANGVLDGLFKERVRDGTSKSTQHKAIIEKEDLVKISTYLEDAASSPVALRLCVWYQLSVHFVTRGLEFHFQLQRDSFNFLHDESGDYVELKHETNMKNHQGGLHNTECQSGKRMYATNGKACPVAMLKLLLEKTSPEATHLFNQYDKDALEDPEGTDIWYFNKPLKNGHLGVSWPSCAKLLV